ncbi:MAG: ATP-binding cassette domain-containing protein [Candidatus Woesearchaeota archaeon]
MVIEVSNLKKVYKTHKRDSGILNAVKSVFWRKYEEKEALKGISFSIKGGEIIGLIGPNGAGKSTTIKALSGVLHPTSGTIKCLGYIPWKQRKKYVKNIGVVFGQKEQLWWDLPPMDTFIFNRDIYDIPRKAFDKRLKSMLQMLKIEGVAKTPVRDLSLGERMKAKLIAALLHNPKLVFLDEPSIGLDVIAKGRMRDFITEVNKRHKTTFIITTHDMQDIERLCKRVIIINHGKIIYDGLLSRIKDKVMCCKVINVKFSKWNKRFKFRGCKIISKDDYELKIEVNLKNQNIRAVIGHLITNYEFVDLFVTDPPIEEIIAKIYDRRQ